MRKCLSVFLVILFTQFIALYVVSKIYVEENVEDTTKKKLLFVSINCKSLISIPPDTINAHRKKAVIFQNKFINFRQSTANGLPINSDEVLFELSKTLQSEFGVRSFRVGDEMKFDFKFNDTWSSFGQWPFAPCDSFQYKPKDIKRCFSEFHRTQNRSLRIAFVGDSMIRSVLEGIVMFIKEEVKLKHFNISEDLMETFKPTYFLDKKFKTNIVLLDEGIEFRFYWATYLMENENFDKASKENGAKELLQKWAYQDEHQQKDPVPDILYIGTGMWNFSIEASILQSLDKHIVMIKELAPLLIKISKRTLIFWHIHPTYLWRTSRKAFLREEGLSWMNQLAYLYLSKNDKIWLWDTYAIFALKEKQECLNLISAFENSSAMPKLFHCFDSFHPGIAARRVAVNMIFNVACNRVLGIKENYCCQ